MVEPENVKGIATEQLFTKQSSTIIESSRPRRSNRPTFSKLILSAEDLNIKNPKRKSKRFPCPTCKTLRSFTTHKQLCRHIQIVHKKIQPEIICEICSQKLRSETYFKRHMATKHSATPRIYVCDFDGRAFTAKDYIRIHMDRHRQYQILTCTICQKSYGSRHTFRRHLKMVRGEKHFPYQILICFAF